MSTPPLSHLSSLPLTADGRAQRRVWPVYQASWARDGYAFRGTFAPEAGSLKPDTPHVRRLLRAEGGSNVLSTDWVFLGGDCDGDTPFSGDD